MNPSELAELLAGIGLLLVLGGVFVMLLGQASEDYIAPKPGNSEGHKTLSDYGYEGEDDAYNDDEWPF